MQTQAQTCSRQLTGEAVADVDQSEHRQNMNCLRAMLAALSKRALPILNASLAFGMSTRRHLANLLIVLAVLLIAGGFTAITQASDSPTVAIPQQANPQEVTAEDGYRILKSKPFLPADFHDRHLEQLWTVWPEPWKTKYAQAVPHEKRQLLFSYYGLIEDPQRKSAESSQESAVSGTPALGYLKTESGNWVMTCLACHGGKVAGQSQAGLPNSHFALQTLAEDLRQVKLANKETLAHLETASLTIPLNVTNGTTNSVIFGVILGTFRRPDMSVDLARTVPPVIHHDVDAPPFWNVKYKTSLYCDGFAPKYHRPLMQFMLLPVNGQSTIYSWEDDFRAIEKWIESVEAPAYPFPIDDTLAASGRLVFEKNCASCHGTYGQGTLVSDREFPAGTPLNALTSAKRDVVKYEQKIIPIGDVATDPVRLQALTATHRQWMKDGWMSDYGNHPVIIEPAGYVAPPLVGIWASAPYFHNGSVPTLWHVLHPVNRPAVWKRTENGYDTNKVGLEVEEFGRLPTGIKTPAERRRYFDTKLKGKSSVGHDYPSALTADEKKALLEYLKTL